MRYIALWYNLLYYTPFVRNRQILGTRQDLPLGPSDIALMEEKIKEDAKIALIPAPPKVLNLFTYI
jgi:hypothetical protein